MPADDKNMKQQIATAAIDLLMHNRYRKLTVKDIVEKCHTTRQTFYYHFSDIPDLLVWVLDIYSDIAVDNVKAASDPEEALKAMFSMAVNLKPYLESGLQNRYREELEKLISDGMKGMFEKVVREKDLYRGCTRSEIKLILRYHSNAVLGILREWTANDTMHLEETVHTVYRLITEGISPNT